MNHAVNGIVSFIIMLHRLNQLFHGKILPVEHIIFHSGKAICDRTNAHALNIVGIIPCAACIVILCIRNAVIGHNGKARRRHLLCIQLLNHVVAANLDVNDMGKLLLECLPQLLIGLEILRIPQFQANLFPGILVKSVEQRQLEHLRDVQIPGQDISLAAPRARLHTPGRAAAPCVLKVLSCVNQLHNLGFRIVKCRLSPSSPGNLAGSL